MIVESILTAILAAFQAVVDLLPLATNIPSITVPMIVKDFSAGFLSSVTGLFAASLAVRFIRSLFPGGF